MKVTIKSTGKQYGITHIRDFGKIHDIRELETRSCNETAIFQAEILTENGIETVVGLAHQGVLIAENCDISTERVNKEDDIKAILSVRNTLFKDMSTEKVYLPGKRIQEPRTFEDIVEYLVNKLYNTLGQIRLAEAMKNGQPIYKIGDRFALITLGFVCAPIKVTKRTFEGNYDTAEVQFYYDLETDYDTDKPLNWNRVSELKLVEWARMSNYEIQNNKQYEKYRSYIAKFNDLININKGEWV